MRGHLRIDRLNKLPAPIQLLKDVLDQAQRSPAIKGSPAAPSQCHRRFDKDDALNNRLAGEYVKHGRSYGEKALCGTFDARK
ncbi:Uncharacterised protein [Mycobacteroides abscessus subsp. abscessus]|nr:Uncharacterised protein [Mycobacteroides abscessus subsp. abscessus]